ncbi:MAG TPA: hypothetical protein VMW66_05185 [Elusimicrobiales bacterium]|nr:hypothetical protein [Elusimicrobiales bacterium]
MTKYWIYYQGRIHGPYEPKELVSKNYFKSESLLCPEACLGHSSDDWKPAKSFQDMLRFLPPSDIVEESPQELISDFKNQKKEETPMQIKHEKGNVYRVEDVQNENNEFADDNAQEREKETNTENNFSRTDYLSLIKQLKERLQETEQKIEKNLKDFNKPRTSRFGVKTDDRAAVKTPKSQSKRQPNFAGEIKPAWANLLEENEILQTIDLSSYVTIEPEEEMPAHITQALDAYRNEQLQYKQEKTFTLPEKNQQDIVAPSTEYETQQTPDTEEIKEPEGILKEEVSTSVEFPPEKEEIPQDEKITGEVDTTKKAIEDVENEYQKFLEENEVEYPKDLSDIKQPQDEQIISREPKKLEVAKEKVEFEIDLNKIEKEKENLEDAETLETDLEDKIKQKPAEETSQSVKIDDTVSLVRGHREKEAAPKEEKISGHKTEEITIEPSDEGASKPLAADISKSPQEQIKEAEEKEVSDTKHPKFTFIDEKVSEAKAEKPRTNLKEKIGAFFKKPREDAKKQIEPEKFDKKNKTDDKLPETADQEQPENEVIERSTLRVAKSIGNAKLTQAKPKTAKIKILIIVIAVMVAFAIAMFFIGTKKDSSVEKFDTNAVESESTIPLAGSETALKSSEQQNIVPPVTENIPQTQPVTEEEEGIDDSSIQQLPIVANASIKAIEIVKNYDLGNGRGTISQWFDNVFASGAPRGHQQEWTGTRLYEDRYVVQYKLLRPKARVEPIFYQFEVDVQEGKIKRGLNNWAIELLLTSKYETSTSLEANNQVGITKYSPETLPQLPLPSTQKKN